MVAAIVLSNHYYCCAKHETWLEPACNFREGSGGTVCIDKTEEAPVHLPITGSVQWVIRSSVSYSVVGGALI